MIAIFEREDALGHMFVRVDERELEAMRGLCRHGQDVTGVADDIRFKDPSIVWSFNDWVEYLET